MEGVLQYKDGSKEDIYGWINNGFNPDPENNGDRWKWHEETIISNEKPISTCICDINTLMTKGCQCGGE
jgi:hypothetical protein